MLGGDLPYAGLTPQAIYVEQVSGSRGIAIADSVEPGFVTRVGLFGELSQLE